MTDFFKTDLREKWNMIYLKAIVWDVTTGCTCPDGLRCKANAKRRRAVPFRLPPEAGDGGVFCAGVYGRSSKIKNAF